MAPPDKVVCWGAARRRQSSDQRRDQRDQAITDLSKIMDVTTVEQTGGTVDVLVGSTPVVLGGRSRGVELGRRTEDGKVSVFFQLKEDKQQLDVKSGEAGALLDSRGKAVDGTIDQLDSITSRMIFEIFFASSLAMPFLSPTSMRNSLPLA